MKKWLLLGFVLILLTACGQSTSLTPSQTDKIQQLKDEIALLNQKQITQKNTILALNVKLDVYRSHAGPDISEFNEVYQPWFRTFELERTAVIYDAQNNQTTVPLRYINASVSFKGRLPQEVEVYDSAIGIWFYWITESNVVQILSYELFSKAVVSGSSLSGSVSLNDGTVLVKFVEENGLSGSEQSTVSEFLSRRFVFTVSN